MGEKEAGEYLNTLLEHISGEVARAEEQANWYMRHAARAKSNYYRIRVPAIVLGIALPQLVVLQIAFPDVRFLSGAAAVLALGVAILTGLDTFFRFGDLWLEDRSAEQAIYSLLRRNGDAVLEVESAPSTEDAIGIAESVLASFRQEYEAVVSGSLRAFVERSSEAAAKPPAPPAALESG